MTELEQEIAHLQELQVKHRQNIRTLEEMLADYGVERPLPPGQQPEVRAGAASHRNGYMGARFVQKGTKY